MNDPHAISDTSLLNGIQTIQWRCPSNIALVKYWGKVGHQIPANPSISITLNEAYTEMSLQYEQIDTAGFELDFYFEGAQNPKFSDKIEQYLNRHLDVLPFVNGMKLTIHSHNSFPHSAGIASSASSMGALALCLCSMEQEVTGALQEEGAFYQKASNLARLASGSASRSVYGGVTVWGQSAAIPGSNDEYAVPFPFEMHDKLKNMHDAVLIVSKAAKSTSSRAGHQLMDAHPYAVARYKQAHENLKNIATAMCEGDMKKFGEILENEALSLHGLMMTSQPSVVLFTPATWQIINQIRAIREQNGLDIYFTLDAGPNIHLLYPAAIKEEVETSIIPKLVVSCEGKTWIPDHLGSGPERLQ